MKKWLTGLQFRHQRYSRHIRSVIVYETARRLGIQTYRQQLDTASSGILLVQEGISDKEANEDTQMRTEEMQAAVLGFG